MKPPEISHPEADCNRLKRQAVGLATCRSGNGNSPDCCPLCELRALPLSARKAWVDNLTADELEFMLTYHSTCAAERARTRRLACRSPARMPRQAVERRS